ncbi:CLUMA_CG015322, isoform A [Clunio marinus]|uniref:Protein RIC1 homolog n=1 Tax=Clunio marinus TaxID=568069 RepID=A0A1J1ITC5_9DIPT|nr:CLUMA_CG015322, isoform A [Clunio marinus]
MYYPIGWPKLLDSQKSPLKLACDKVKILFAVVYERSICIWFCKPCVPITYHQRTDKCITENGLNAFVEWKIDSSKLVIATNDGALIIYDVQVDDDSTGGLYTQNDSPFNYLRRDSAELFIKETIPSLKLNLSIIVKLYCNIKSISCVNVSQMMVATDKLSVFRINWEGLEERDYSLDLRRIPFSINQQVHYAVPILDKEAYVVSMDYSPLLAGFSIVLKDGRAAFLTSNNLKFDPNQVSGIWAQGLEDATCTAINHKHRLIAFGRKNSKDFPGSQGYVREMKWTPDGCAMVLCWSGGISVWSTYGNMLMCSLAWDYGLNVDLNKQNPLNITSLDWSTEGYQLLMIQQHTKISEDGETIENQTRIIQLHLIKSVLSVNPAMSSHPFLLLQGDDKLYLNRGDALQKMYAHYASLEKSKNYLEVHGGGEKMEEDYGYYNFGSDNKKTITSINTLSESKHWIIITLPTQYAASNWPIRYSAIDSSGNNIAIAGRTGMALYSLITRKWKLFGNETQEKDFVVSGAILWWNNFVILGSYSLVDHSDEIRMYPKDSKLDNRFASIVKINSPVMLMNIYNNQLIMFTSDGYVSIFSVVQHSLDTLNLIKLKVYDIKNLCVHPACVVSVSLANLKNDANVKSPANQHSDTLLLNVIECMWVSNSSKVHLKDSLWLFCGNNGMRVWLPVFPRPGENGSRSLRHTFMSKRIMLTFCLKIYPLVILFEEAIILGAENDTILYTNDSGLHFSLPFCILERSTPVYLHQILRQLIRRNLGYNAWEIARTCTSLPYFPHALELLLHEVLEEEATSKEPIPDALLPSVLEFIQEFPVYLQTVVQCARKTEIALWPYLFSMAGKPKDLFQQCITQNQLEIAASYLIILQNLEPSSVSRQYATMLLDTALEQKKWDLAKDLVRFLRAIDPNDVESPRTSIVMGSRFSVSSVQNTAIPSPEDLTLILGNITRGRTLETKPDTPTNKDKFVISTVNPTLRNQRRVSQTPKEKLKIVEDFFIEDILQRHANKLLQNRKLEDLGFMAAKLDFQLVGWLSKEKDKSAKIDDFVTTLKQLHDQLEWPKPSIENITNTQIEAGSSSQTPIPDATESGYKSFSHSNELDNLGGYLSSYQKAGNFTLDGKFNHDVEANLLPKIDLMSVASEQVSLLWDDDKLNSGGQNFMNFELDEDQSYHNAIEEQKRKDAKSKQAIQKMEIKLRYLLQLFTEGDCLEFSLLLSIMLLDKASVLRITNKAIRSNSLILCRKLRNGLKDITRWSLYDLGYQSFMLSLKSQISVLDNFIIREESISPVLAMMNKESVEHTQTVSSESLIKDMTDIMETSQKSHENKLNTSGSSTTGTNNVLERKNSSEEKRSLTSKSHSLNIMKTSNLSTNQHMNEFRKSSSSEHSHINELKDIEETLEFENIDEDDGGRVMFCNVTRLN